ncbi:DinB family protein [Histidinibacterium aquaticum]|uniref:Nuclease n=1 Tax=Histidinibacterium aquaticum TaxID=2613962 RepID=A0A5J5GN36_9RHOB|nr:DinB family protein [Histidinibacterium aquaticum]KAA9009786.1 nuclease [Histidinibacterium aquaticum]
MSGAAHPYLRMALNNAWANSTLYGALLELPQAEFTAPRPGFFPSLAATMGHILEVDLYYLDALEEGGQGRALREARIEGTASELGEQQAGADMRLAQFCMGLTEETLAATRETERAEGPVTERVDALLLHLLQHQVHHRGQAHVQLQEAGIAPPQLDEFHLVYDRAPSAEAYHG